MGLSAAITQRPASREDAAAVAALASADETVLLGRPSQLGESDILGWWTRTDRERDSLLLEEDGRPVGAVWFAAPDDELGGFVGIVAQGVKGCGLGGYREVRRFYDMAIELAGPPPAPALPDGLTLEVLRAEDVRAFHDAMGEAFEDHWEHHSVPFEQWWEEKQGAPGFDPTLWFVVRDGDEIAATIRNDPERNGGGYVGALGVRCPWRGRGLGRALLLQTFGEFQRRGAGRVTLGVDAESLTGATRLYESVGMEVESETVAFEKELR